nr:MAG TPA: hypothetical protein [Crassvirales sp.]
MIELLLTKLSNSFENSSFVIIIYFELQYPY